MNSTKINDSNFLNTSINSPNPNRQNFPMIYDSNRKTQFNINLTLKKPTENFKSTNLNSNVILESPNRKKHINKNIIDSK